MSYIGKCYTILNDDEETVAQWPEIKTGFAFQILKVENRDGLYPGVTRLRCLVTDKIFDVEYPLHDGGESWFWCLVALDEAGELSLKPLKERPLKQEPLGKIHMGHFHGREVDIAYALSALAAQEGCDGEEYDLMEKASRYIRYLETQLNA